jgi:hypothetical protein
MGFPFKLCFLDVKVPQKHRLGLHALLFHHEVIHGPMSLAIFGAVLVENRPRCDSLRLVW